MPGLTNGLEFEIASITNSRSLTRSMSITLRGSVGTPARWERTWPIVVSPLPWRPYSGT